MKRVSIMSFGDCISLSNFVKIRDFTSDKFKTFKISFHIITPLSLATASKNSVCSSVVTRATKEYPDYIKFNRYLSEIYGACLSSSVNGLGDNQDIVVSSSSISNKYSLDKEDLERICTDLIMDAVFDPLSDKTGNFDENGFKQEKRQLLENYLSMFNDKSDYARFKCKSYFYESEPAGINKYGDEKSIRALERDQLLDYWNRLARSSHIEILILGNCNFKKIAEIISKGIPISQLTNNLSNKIILKADKVKNYSEEMKLSQSKMVLAYRTGVYPADSLPTSIAAMILGGSPNSKLFLNIREKESLCYYCYSRSYNLKGSMFIETGIDAVNLELAFTLIEKQIDEIKKGNITDKEISDAKLSLINGIDSVYDSIDETEHWYISQIFNSRMKSTNEKIDQIKNVRKDDIIQAAGKITLDTVYTLKGVV
jgi:predicted Zn-dependent peptidase